MRWLPRRLGSAGAAQGPGQAARDHRHPVAAHRVLHRRRDRDNQPVPLRQQGVQAGWTDAQPGEWGPAIGTGRVEV